MKTLLAKSPVRVLAVGLVAAIALLAASVAAASGRSDHGHHHGNGNGHGHGNGNGNGQGHGGHGRGRDEHVLLLSVDGLHQADLRWYDQTHPFSALASLSRNGTEFTQAKTPVPSDSFPGMVGQLTGGNPATTGIYYDVSYNRELLPPGTTECAGAKPGTEVAFDESIDKNSAALDAGQGLSGLPGNILNLTGNPAELIDPAKLPVNPHTCKPVYPHEYLKVNTVFDVAHEAGLRTAWSDKHPAYEILDGPSGNGVEDFFTPEINSDAPTEGASNDWTTDNALTEQYDSYKVQAVVNEINGFDHSGHEAVGTPAVFGMNFQTVSTAQKLPESDGLKGGYEADGTPGPLLRRALDYINTEVGTMLAALHARHLDKSTTVILSAKHGQSPVSPSALTRIPDGPILEGLNEAWAAAHPEATEPLVAFTLDDDGMLIWLHDRSPQALAFAKAYLLGHNGVGNDINGAPKPYTSSGLTKLYAGTEAADYFGTSVSDPRVPDLFGISQYGVVYTGKQGKIAEHGGANPADREVPLVVSGGAVDAGAVSSQPVETTQIAPTILRLLGLDPGALQAVQIEGTEALNVR
ncbi:MAG: alkaline phosphatase family protein [Actinobacteria bacterium]|nr:alkaline phosphatase family protein [Actinomycetota bacterium]